MRFQDHILQGKVAKRYSNPPRNRAMLFGGFNPASLFAAGEQGVFYDYSDLSSMFQDAAGTTPVTAAGQQLGKMLDKSGRGNHWVQATAAARPTLQQDAGGRYYINLDGADDCGQTAAAVDFSATNKVQSFVGFRKDADLSGSFLHELSISAAVNNNTFGLDTNGAAANGAWLGGFCMGTVSSVCDTGAATCGAVNLFIVSHLADISQATAPLANTFRKNGAVLPSSGANNAAAPGSGNFSAAQILYLYSRGGTSLRLQGRVYQHIILGRAFTASEIANTETYIANKMGGMPP